MVLAKSYFFGKFWANYMKTANKQKQKLDKKRWYCDYIIEEIECIWNWRSERRRKQNKTELSKTTIRKTKLK